MLAKTRTLVEAVTAAHGRLRHRRRLREVRPPRRAEQLVHPPHPRAVLGAGRRTTPQRSDKADAYDTLFTVLVTLSKVVAPLLPMLAEEIHPGLTGERVGAPRGLARCLERCPHDPDLVQAMDEVRAVCSAALGLREDHRLRGRLPLPR